ncbi:ROK family transcriptional regulator [Nocardioides sp. Root140]|uniref:ROK family transcriptional regulator n=1 Tax=Nocardioides sp. Root140 TaxID=1736460 RepID=UPI0006FAB3A2|nr:ROK family protein [Nocardioides sp. Root140]KQY57160.1 hypothetical protein ASD30_13005 [Nocardioides sp. Root140]
MLRSPFVTLARGRFGSASGRLLEQVRGGRVVTREQLVRATGLSPATVTRNVNALVEGRVLRERPDLVTVGATGRPGLPVEVDPEEYVVVGVHLGTRLLTVALGDLAGQVIVSRTREREPHDVPDFTWVGEQVIDMLRDLPRRVPLAAGLVAPFAELRLDRNRTAEQLQEVLGLDVATSDHIAAVAAAEFIHRRHGTGGVTAYLYARNTAGFAVAADKGEQTEVSRVASLAHFPTRSTVPCGCGRTGCFQAAVSDHTVARLAHDAGVVPRAEIDEVHRVAADGVPAARRLLADRARLLGEIAAVVRDMVNPDRMILVGQAFTGFPGVLDEVVSAFGSATALPPIELSFTRFGTEIQALAACTIALGPVYDDPLAALPTHRRPRATRRTTA